MHVIKALNLSAADETSSDPYVKLKLTGLPKGNVLQRARTTVGGTAGDVKPGPYTHLTLPTIYPLCISLAAGSFPKQHYSAMSVRHRLRSNHLSQ